MYQIIISDTVQCQYHIVSGTEQSCHNISLLCCTKNRSNCIIYFLIIDKKNENNTIVFVVYRKADSWPQKLIMQLMPKQLIGNIGGAYLKNSKSVLFHPSPCDALESLTKVMSTGFVSIYDFINIIG